MALAGAEEQARAIDPPQRRLEPVFVLGMLQRTGTNYLYDLFRLHSDAALLTPRWEDHLLRHTDHLVAYANAVDKSWRLQQCGSPEERARLLRHLGDGLGSFLMETAAGKRAVTKTPSVQNLPRFFELFPDAYLVLLVRDGRSVTESVVRSWGFTYGIAARKWADGARAVLDFDAANREGSGRYRIVRYEDLVADLEGTFADVLRFCDLDLARYDFDAARNLPLRGSSRDRGGRADLHWDPVEKPADFDGVERFGSWSDRKHRQFNIAAADLQRALGYETKDVGSPGPLLRLDGLIKDLNWGLVRRRPFRAISRYRRRRRMSRSRQAEPHAVPGRSA